MKIRRTCISRVASTVDRKIQDVGKRLLTVSVSLDYYPQSSNISQLDEIVKSLFRLSNGYTLIIHGYLNTVAHIRAVPCAGYSDLGTIPGS